MAISSYGSSVDRIIRSSANNGKSLFEDGKSGVISTTTWYQGDLLCYDTSTNVIRQVAATTDAATILGIADNTVILGQLNSPYAGLTLTNSTQSTPGFVGPKYGVSASLICHTGDTLVFGQKMYLVDATNTQTVSGTDPGDHNYIGLYMGPGLTSAPALTLVPVLLGARYPAATATGLNF
jgi:hypothetical protein